MKKITIGLFIDTYYPMVDGVVTVVDNYAKNLSKKANVIVFCPEVSSEYDDSKFDYKVVRCKSIPIPFLDYSLPLPKLDIKFKQELKKYNLDIIHIHSPFTLGKTAAMYAKENNIPLIGTIHSQYKQDILKYIKSEKLATFILNQNCMNVYNMCDECWAVNSEIAKMFHEEYGYSKMPRVMNNATEMTLIKNKKESDKLINDKYNLSSDTKLFLYVGRINVIKNILFTIDALKELDNLNVPFKWKMMFVGSGGEEDILINKIKDCNLEDKVIMAGKVMDRNLLASIYARSDLFLFPSLYDASSIVQIEAASQKTPGIFLEGAKTTATIKNNHNGFIVKNDVKEYANKIKEVMLDKDLYNKVSSNAYKEVYKTWADAIDEVYDLYIKHINKKGEHNEN